MTCSERGRNRREAVGRLTQRSTRRSRSLATAKVGWAPCGDGAPWKGFSGFCKAGRRRDVFDLLVRRTLPLTMMPSAKIGSYQICGIIDTEYAKIAAFRVKIRKINDRDVSLETGTGCRLD